LEAVTEADAAFAKEAKPALRPLTAAKPKQNRFINFNQRENDYSHYEKLERAYLEKKYNAQ
ncbi:MAG: hypothetical protein FWB80_13395, partial [Defluviitaleaceae bacterium]|nr:hypothetical protein [Defluviitaleaceae bacterium]